ncbi:hypothetical protein ACK3TF_004864 [Chlorella vulgaris]
MTGTPRCGGPVLDNASRLLCGLVFTALGSDRLPAATPTAHQLLSAFGFRSILARSRALEAVRRARAQPRRRPANDADIIEYPKVVPQEQEGRGRRRAALRLARRLPRQAKLLLPTVYAYSHTAASSSQQAAVPMSARPTVDGTGQFEIFSSSCRPCEPAPARPPGHQTMVPALIGKLQWGAPRGPGAAKARFTRKDGTMTAEPPAQHAPQSARDFGHAPLGGLSAARSAAHSGFWTCPAGGGDPRVAGVRSLRVRTAVVKSEGKVDLTHAIAGAEYALGFSQTVIRSQLMVVRSPSSGRSYLGNVAELSCASLLGTVQQACSGTVQQACSAH